MMIARLVRRGAAVVLAIVVLFAVAGCGGDAATSAGPTAAPTPTPVDTAAEFSRIVGATSFSALATISGTVSVDGAAGTVEGTVRMSGADAVAVVTTHVGDADETTERITVGADGWVKRGLGPWLASPPGTTTASLSLGAWLRSLAALQVVGTEAHRGRELVHLRATGADPVAPEALGFDGTGVTGAGTTVELYAEADGTPAALAVEASWSAPSDGGSTSIELALEYRISDVGQSITIAAPTDVWTTYTNAGLGYTMGLPKGWSVTATASGDNYLVGGVEYVYVYPERDAVGLSLDEFQAAVSATYKSQLKVDPQEVRPATLGGEPSKLLLFTWSADDGSPLALLDMIAMHRDAGWEVFMITSGGPTLNDDATLFDTFLASFAFLR
jgi:hypothetical protein